MSEIKEPSKKPIKSSAKPGEDAVLIYCILKAADVKMSIAHGEAIAVLMNQLMGTNFTGNAMRQKLSKIRNRVLEFYAIDPDIKLPTPRKRGPPRLQAKAKKGKVQHSSDESIIGTPLSRIDSPLLEATPKRLSERAKRLSISYREPEEDGETDYSSDTGYAKLESDLQFDEGI